MKALVIPQDKTEPVREVDVPTGEGADTLSTLQGLVGGLIQALPFPDGLTGDALDDATAYVNEEGKYDPECTMNTRATDVMLPILGLRDVVMGNLVVCGFDAAEGENRDVPDKAVAWVMRVTREATGQTKPDA